MPGGIPYIIGNEAAERFSFYGMKAILFVFMTQYLLNTERRLEPLSDEDAKIWIHNFVAATYFFPVIGAILSDWLFGKYHTILSLSIVYCLGHVVMAYVDYPALLEPDVSGQIAAYGMEPRYILMLGLGLIAMGAGGIKPCVSAHVGDQFGASNQHLIPRVFRWFYFSINLGSMFSTILTPFLLDTLGPAWAFGVPGFLMMIATAVFWMGRQQFIHVPPAGSHFFKETFSKQGIRAIFNLIPLYCFIAMFWCLFDQTASAWVEQATKMNTTLKLGSNEVTFLPSQIQFLNPLLVMILIPVFSQIIYPLMGRFFEVTPLRKIGLGLFVTVPAFAIPAWLEMCITQGDKPHIIWHLWAYLIITGAEIMVSITALEFSYTQAPKAMKSFIMGLFLLSVAAGNEFTVFTNQLVKELRARELTYLEGANYYWFFTTTMLLTAIGFVIWSQFYQGATYIQGEDSDAAIAEAVSE